MTKSKYARGFRGSHGLVVGVVYVLFEDKSPQPLLPRLPVLVLNAPAEPIEFWLPVRLSEVALLLSFMLLTLPIISTTTSSPQATHSSRLACAFFTYSSP